MADFAFYTYTSDKSLDYKIRLSTVTAAQQDPANPAGARDVDESVAVGKNRNSIGLHARGFRLGRTVGTAPNTFTRTTFFPVCAAAQYSGTAIGSTITLSGVAWTVLSKTPEKAV